MDIKDIKNKLSRVTLQALLSEQVSEVNQALSSAVQASENNNPLAMGVYLGVATKTIRDLQYLIDTDDQILKSRFVELHNTIVND